MTRPSLRSRISFAAAIGIASCCLYLISRAAYADWYTDSSALWRGARLLLERKDPYDLIGPGREYPYPYTLHYPLSSVVAFIPLAWLSEVAADVVFIFGSAFLFAFCATKDSWNRIWIFPSAAFVVNARAGQFASLVSAGFFLPWAAAVLPIKPSTGLAIMGSWVERRAWLFAGITAGLLFAVAFALDPAWFPKWLHGTLESGEYVSPITRMGGFVLLLAVVRWRQREARLLLLLAIMPAVQSWYECLLPMLVARTKRECQVLSLTSSLGYLLQIPLVLTMPGRELGLPVVGNLMLAFAYLPALIVVIRRPNEGD